MMATYLNVRFFLVAKCTKKSKVLQQALIENAELRNENNILREENESIAELLSFYEKEIQAALKKITIETVCLSAD